MRKLSQNGICVGAVIKSVKQFTASTKPQMLVFCLLGVNGLLSIYSSAVGISDAFAFVHKQYRPLEPLPDGLRGITGTLPASQQFSYFAPQVCSVFRIQVALGNSQTKQVRDVVFNPTGEAALLLSALNSSTQEEKYARTIAASYASFALDHNRDCDSARVTIEAEYLPPLRQSTQTQPYWEVVYAYYFKP